MLKSSDANKLENDQLRLGTLSCVVHAVLFGVSFLFCFIFMFILLLSTFSITVLACPPRWCVVHTSQATTWLAGMIFKARPICCSIWSAIPYRIVHIWVANFIWTCGIVVTVVTFIVLAILTHMCSQSLVSFSSAFASSVVSSFTSFESMPDHTCYY